MNVFNFRYFHIVKTSNYRALFSPTKSKLIVFGGWVAALITPVTYTAAGKDYVFQPGKFFCFMEAKFSYFVIPFYAFIAISMSIVIVCYLSVFKALKVHEKTVANNLRTGNVRQSALSVEDIKVTKILFATVVGFVICWTSTNGLFDKAPARRFLGDFINFSDPFFFQLYFRGFFAIQTKFIFSCDGTTLLNHDGFGRKYFLIPAAILRNREAQYIQFLPKPS